jgi:hypothetical protein
VPGFPSRYIPPAVLAAPALPLPLPLPPMFGHGCPVPLRLGADGDGVAWDELADVCELAVPVAVLVEALAMVRPRARLAPSAPAPTAVPMSGRVILTWFSFAPGRAGHEPALNQ